MSNITLTNTPFPTTMPGYISGADGSSSSELGNMASLTPDALLAYCNAQLNGIDGQVQTYMDQQNTQLSEKEALQQCEQLMSQYSNGSAPPTYAALQTLTAQMQQAISGLPANDPVAAQVQGVISNMLGSSGATDAAGDGYKGWSATNWATFNTQLQGIGQDVDSNAEIGMIQIQSLVSQRQTIVQLTTNMMSTLSQTDQSIAQENRHVRGGGR